MFRELESGHWCQGLPCSGDRWDYLGVDISGVRVAPRIQDVNPAAYRPDIQGLRALAVLAVISFHAGLPIHGGFIGVDIFFVISGFVITGMLLRDRDREGKFRFVNFYIRRARRLAPALTVVLIFTIFVSFFLLSPFGPQQNVAQTALGAVLNVPNLVIANSVGNYFDPSAESNPLLNTWSLGVEEQFYWIFPVLLAMLTLFGKRISSARVRNILIISGLILVSVFFNAIAASSTFYTALPWLSSFYNPLPRFWEFAAGAILAILLRGNPKIPNLVAYVSAFFGSALLVYAFISINETVPFPGRSTLLPVAGTFLLILAGSSGTATNFVSQGLAWRPFVRIGDWSYSLYLWHWPLIVFTYLITNGNQTAVLIATGISFMPAVMSYHYVENPTRFRKIWTAKMNVQFAVLVFLLPLAISISFLVASNSIAASDWAKRNYAASMNQHVPYEARCDFDMNIRTVFPIECEWNSNLTGEPIYLVGDSQAGHFSEAVIEAGRQLDRPTWVSIAGACAYLPDVVEPGLEHCREYVDASLSWLKDSEPGTVVIAMADSRWTDPSSDYFFPDGRSIVETGEKLRILESGLTKVVNTLESAGQEVLIVQAVPTFWKPGTYWTWEGCGALPLSLWNCESEYSFDLIDLQQKDSRNIVNLVAKSTAANVLDLRDEYCSSLVCSNSRNGELVYKDRTHITVKEAERLTPRFAEALKSSG